MIDSCAWRAGVAAVILASASAPVLGQTTAYRIFIGGDAVGHMTVVEDASRVSVDYDVKQNGRGPTISEYLQLDERGYPVDWTISGSTTFGSAVDEYFRIEGNTASWRDTTGPGEAPIDGAAHFYMQQNGSFYSAGLLARALLAEPSGRIELYPGGEATIVERDTFSFDGPDGEVDATTYEIFGVSLAPTAVTLDDTGELFAVASPRSILIREGYEAADRPLRDYVTRLSTERFVEIQSSTSHEFDGPVRIRNVRVFNPTLPGLTDLRDVVVYGDRIASIQAPDGAATDGEITIEGEGGTLVPGLYEMHGHISQENALLNLLAGVTSVRDMGNDNEVLAGLIERIDRGIIAGPRITRSCFIEGESEFSAATGETVASLEEALDIVRWCGARDFYQVKLYNSMRPEWASALVEEAHRLGMRVSGHVPAFSSADAMLDAGFDEITHINQLMLGWVLNEGEDTRTLFRFTAMQRFPDLDLDGDRVQTTIASMVAKGVAHDPTLAIHEQGLTAVDGEVAPVARGLIDRLPVNTQRSYRAEMFGTESQAERDRYVEAFETIVQTLTRMHEAGVLLLPGTDMGGWFTYHRELELFERLGMTPAEVLRRATLDMAVHLGQDEDLGSITKGKYADFFLVPGDPTADLGELREVRMVVADGSFYFPAEVYPWFGVVPATIPPRVNAAE